jgi:hypothetical protein
VGKTTCALWIALEWLVRRQVERPVVLIDLDVHGTEVADLLLAPYAAPALSRWRVGMLDLLTGEAGTNRTFDRLLAEDLRDLQNPASWSPLDLKLPVWKPDDARSGLIALPSFREREPRARARVASRENLALRYTVDAFGRVQIQRRMEALLRFLLQEVQPPLILIDNSPFYLEMGKAVLDLLREWADGKKDPPAGIVCREVVVLGRDLQEWPAALADLAAKAEAERKREEKAALAMRRWVINKDEHLSVEGGETCSTHGLLLSASSPGDPTREGLDLRAAAGYLMREDVLHVPWQEIAARGMYNFWSGTETWEGLGKIPRPLDFFQPAVADPGLASPRRWDGTRWSPCEFADWLK